MLPLSLAPFDAVVIIVKCKEGSEKPQTTQANATALVQMGRSSTSRWTFVCISEVKVDSVTEIKKNLI